MAGKCVGMREGEVFVGNVETPKGIGTHLSRLKTARLGEVALDIFGEPLDPKEHLPLFIGESEYDAYNEIMEERYLRVARGVN